MGVDSPLAVATALCGSAVHIHTSAVIGRLRVGPTPAQLQRTLLKPERIYFEFKLHVTIIVEGPSSFSLVTVPCEHWELVPVEARRRDIWLWTVSHIM